MSLHKVKTFQYSPISWKQYQSKGPVRCFRCQVFGHLAKNCLNRPRCSRCRHSHGPDECRRPPPTPETDLKNYYCANCETKGHWAGFLKCPKRIKAEADKEDRINKKKTENPPAPKNDQRAPTKNDFVVEPKRARGAPAPVAVNETHAPTWGPAPQNNVSTRTGGVWATLNDDANSLFGKTPAEIISHCDEYVTKSRNLDNPAAKKAAYLEFILSLS